MSGRRQTLSRVSPSWYERKRIEERDLRFYFIVTAQRFPFTRKFLAIARKADKQNRYA